MAAGYTKQTVYTIVMFLSIHIFELELELKLIMCKQFEKIFYRYYAILFARLYSNF